MGMMSKATRLPERPKPPSWEEIAEDVEGAQNDDVVFVVGKESLPVSSGVSTGTSSSEKSFNSSTASDLSDQDGSQIDPEKVQASYSSVLRLIALYSELKDAPAKLKEQYSHLKQMGDEMTQSITELKTLAQNINADSPSKTVNTSSIRDSGKSKGKQKKKK